MRINKGIINDLSRKGGQNEEENLDHSNLGGPFNSVSAAGFGAERPYIILPRLLFASVPAQK